MRFLFLTQYFPPEIGAPQVRLASMIGELESAGHSVEVITAMPNHPTGKIFQQYKGKFYCQEVWGNIRIHRVWIYPSLGAGLKRMLNYFSFTITSLIGLFRATKPDYIFVESPPLFLSFSGYILSQFWRVPFIFNVADLWPDSVKELGIIKDGPLLRIAEVLEKWTYRKSKYVNAVTEGIRTILIQDKKVPEQKVLFLPNGVDINLFKPSSPEEELSKELGVENKKLILYAGTIGFAQGLETALQAMGIVQNIVPEAMLIIIGDGSEKEKLVQIAHRLQLSNVKFLEPQPPEFVARLYSIAYAGFASLRDLPLFEGARPSKVFPVMASGKPVLYSGRGEGARLIKDANAGIVVQPEQSKDLADAICSLLNNRELANDLGKNGRFYVENHLSWSAIVEKWILQLVEKTEDFSKSNISVNREKSIGL